jgi:hypothetical protein
MFIWVCIVWFVSYLGCIVRIYWIDLDLCPSLRWLIAFSAQMRLLQIVDPQLASYGVENPIFAVIQLAQTTMRSELGKITLDKTFEERDTLNEKIVVSLICSSVFFFNSLIVKNPTCICFVFRTYIPL